MKMKRSEKLGMLTGLVVGVLLLLISVFMIFQTTCKVWGSQITPTQAEKNGLENSFRYTDGKLKSTTERMTRSLTRVVKPSNATAQGIDVSYHQGTIDWEKVKNSGQVDFAIIRCGIGMDQTNQDDTQWENNTSECERLGIPYGTFLYSYADTVEKARSEAQHVVRLVQGKNLTYPIYYDMEDNSVMNKIDSKTAGEIAQTFLNTLEANGYKNVAVYSSKSLFETKLTADIFNRYPRWVAHYNDTCGYQGSYHMWQYTNKGQIDGITGNVDLDYKIGNWTSAGYTPAPATPTTPAAPAAPATPVAPTTAVKKTTVSNPKATTIKSLKKSGKKAVKITYKKVSGVSGYQIYMSTKKKSGYKKIATLSSKKSSYTKGKLKKGKKYYFKVRTMKKVSGKYRYSSFSKVRSIKR
jgi:GH25 family lysozyme M1 (1,4-beta-N-acetylmuramidase)